VKYSDLISYREVPSLIEDKVLEHFINLIQEVKTFMESKTKVVNSIIAYFWLTDLAYLADVIQKFNLLNHELQAGITIRGQD